ncbi:MAG: uncharacterized protein QOK17_535 [Sphingomonadales bacterium]|jgi:uncharacterized protein YbaP (TraB family)|nr:uncharacterized protein [Sphingomonadales bacterium]
MGLNWLRTVSAALAAMGLAWGIPAAAETPAGAHPAMWKLADADTTIYLFGSFHLLPKGLAWRTPAFDRALGSSDVLVLEIANLDDQMAIAQTLMTLGMSPGQPPLAERVPAGKRDALKAMVAESGIPEAFLDRMETWAAGLMLTGVEFKRLGLDPDSGVERTLGAAWKTSGKPVEGLETAEQQFGFFDRLSEDSQRKFLVALLDTPDKSKREFAEMLTAWEAGDVDGIARSFDDETQMSAELREALMKQRNARWSEWLKARLDKPGTVFVAVGAGHLAGSDSVLRLLAAKGLKVTRLQ